MLRLFILILLFNNVGCNSNTQTKSLNPENEGNLNKKGQVRSDTAIEKKLIIKNELLTQIETEFFNKIKLENPFIIISDSVQRFYFQDDTIPQINKFIFSQDSLMENGYVYFDLKFYGNVTNVNISYEFSLGQASVGFGGICGNGINDYLHTFISCGITSCITEVYQNGKKLFRKDKLN